MTLTPSAALSWLRSAISCCTSTSSCSATSRLNILTATTCLVGRWILHNQDPTGHSQSIGRLRNQAFSPIELLKSTHALYTNPKEPFPTRSVFSYSSGDWCILHTHSLNPRPPRRYQVPHEFSIRMLVVHVFPRPALLREPGRPRGQPLLGSK